MPALEPRDNSPKSAKHLLRRFAGPVVSLLCLAAAARWILGQPMPRFPNTPGAIGLLVAAAATTLGLCLARGWRWGRLLSLVGIRDLGAEPYALTAVGYMGNTVLPARGGDFMRIGLLSRRSGADWKAIAGTLIPERLLDVVALGVVLVILSVAGAAHSPLGLWPAALSVAGLVVLGVALSSYHALRVRGRLEGVADRVRPFTRGTRLLVSVTGIELFGLTLGLWAFETAVLWLVAAASYDELPIVGVSFVVVLASLATAIPAAPGFIGTLDAAVILGLHAAGVPSSETLAIAVLYRLTLFVPVTIVGGLTLLLRYGGVSAFRVRRETAASLD